MEDILNDTNPNGLTDILKRNESTVNKLFAPLTDDEVIEFAGVRFEQRAELKSGYIGETLYNQ